MSERVFWILAATLVALGIAGTWYGSTHVSVQSETATYKTPEESDSYTRFVLEGYDILRDNYWQKTTDTDLSNAFQIVVQKFASSTLTLKAQDRAGVATIIRAALDGTAPAEKKKTAETILAAVLYNIAPVGRNQLLTQQATTDLHNEVNNVNPANNLYQNLGVENGASAASVQAAYETKQAELAASSSPEAKKELDKIAYAKEVLTDTNAKANYDQNKVEPTVFAHLANPSTLYLYIKQMSPATESEFEQAVREYVKKGVTSMILDLRGNIGGDLTTSLTFLGLYSGPNAYAYDLFHHGEYEAQRTLGLAAMPELKNIRETAILTDGMTQSTAEVITAAMKRVNLAASVGATTRGWGSIEGQFPMKTVIDEGGAHEILLVVMLTVNDTNQPIEGNGVKPDVDTHALDWKTQLAQQFFSSDLVRAVQKQVALPPQK